MPSVLNVLVVEDNPDFSFWVSEALLRMPFPRMIVSTAECIDEAFQQMECLLPDVILLDLGLPGEEGLSALIKMQTKYPKVPVIVLTGLNSDELAINAMHLGAEDYVPKDTMDVQQLVRSLRYAITRKQSQLSARKIALLEQQHDFVAMLTHDLKNPLLGMNRVLEALLEHAAGPLTEDQRSLLMQMQSSNCDLLGLIQNMLEIYRADQSPLPRQKIVLSLSSLANRLVKQWETPAKQQQIGLKVDADDTSCLISCDPPSIDRLMANLLSNALKFTPSGGNITISAHCESDKVILRVADSGVGIAKEDIAKLFNRFSQVKDGRQSMYGSGLGLYVCRRIVDEHGGEIYCTSKPGEGSTFTVELPCRRVCEPACC